MFLETIIGIGLAPVIRSAVQYIKPAWDSWSGKFTPVINTIAAMGFGVLFSYLSDKVTPTGQDLVVTLSIGVLSGFAAVLYNDSRVQIEEGRQ